MYKLTVISLAALSLLAGCVVPVQTGISPINSNQNMGVNFGNDTSTWAFDGECDDPRFTGFGMAAVLSNTDMNRDATDCRDLFNAGRIQLIQGGQQFTRQQNTPQQNIGRQQINSQGFNFGDDSSPFAFDGECDDPRFFGFGMAAFVDNSNMFRDATDCINGINSGAISLL